MIDMIDLCKIKEDFSVLVKEAQPWTLTQFVMWLDLKLSEFKIKGYMVLDHQSKTKPQWIAADDNSSDVAPTPAPCRQCNKHDTNFYSDIHAVPSSKRLRQSESSDNSEPIRGGVGLIDLSQTEPPRRASHPDLSMANRRGNNSLGLNRMEKNVPVPVPRQPSSSLNVGRDIGRKETVIEIDPISPTEKMFVTSSISKTSTPVQSHSLTVPKPKPKPPSVGTVLYTSTQTSTMPTFSTGHLSSSPRTSSTFSNRNFALGAPPTIASSQAQPSISSNLDEMIAQAVKFNEIRTDSASSQSASRVENQSFPSTSQENVQTSNSSHSSFVDQSHGQNVQLSSPTKTAVPVALHANIDNITRDESQSRSSSDITEIKIEHVETIEDENITDPFLAGQSFDTIDSSQYSTIATDSPVQTHGPVGADPLRSRQMMLMKAQRLANQRGQMQSGLPKQGLVDPETAKAHQMVELVNGSGVYVYEKTVAQTFNVGSESQTGTYNGEKMARFLLNVFWTRKELIGATLSKSGKLRGKKILNQQIIEAILGKLDDIDNDTSGNDSFYHEQDSMSYLQGVGQTLPPPTYGQAEIDLPTFEDPIVRRALQDTRPPSRNLWSKIITRCAYHLLSKGVPRKHDYQMFAEQFYRRYPCVGTTRGPNPWTELSQEVSQKVRNLRKKIRRLSDQGKTLVFVNKGPIHFANDN